MLNPTQVTFARNRLKDMNHNRIAVLQGTTVGGPSLNDFVRAHQHGLRNREAERFRGLHVDHKLELRR